MKALGLDVGIASLGWTVLDSTEGRIIDSGVLAFEVPEDRKRKSNKRTHGEVRRRKTQTARRRARMNDVRKLLSQSGVLPNSDRHALRDAAWRISDESFRSPPPSPWRLRADGLRRQLGNDEWAVVLGHLVGHRAYFSNAKRKSNEVPNSDAESSDDEGKVLAALRNNDRELNRAVTTGKVETVGEWLSLFERQRNRGGDYRFSIRREWVIDETKLLFARQLAKGNPNASSELHGSFAAIAFRQLPVKSSSELGKCTFEIAEYRAARHSYSFELFRLLVRLHNLKVVDDSGEAPPRRLSVKEIAKIVEVANNQDMVTYATLRRELKFAKHERIDGAPDRTAEKKDIFNRTKGHTLPGIRALRTVVTNYGPAIWDELQRDRDKLDAIAAAIAHHDDLIEIGRQLNGIGLEPKLVAVLVDAADGGGLGFFKGTGHLSIKALRNVEPRLWAGKNLHESLIDLAKTDPCYDPINDRSSRKPAIDGYGPEAVRLWLNRINREGKAQIEEVVSSQTASRAVRETFKQVLFILQMHPDIKAIHLEMAREVGKSAEARKKIEIEQTHREKQRTDSRVDFLTTFKRPPTENEESRWVLWRQQIGKCVYTGDDISCACVIDGDGRAEIDHPLPQSRFHNRSLDNQVLCLAHANQNKESRTPYEWFRDEGRLGEWEGFAAHARTMFKGKAFERKLKNLLIVDVEHLEQSFKNRDLVDTRWIAKFLLGGLERLGTPEAPIRVQPVNAGLVGLVRHAWGLGAWKRDPTDPTKRRPDDRHHALDAAVVATIDQALVQRLTQAYQRAEKREELFPLKNFRTPWLGFRRELVDRLYGNGAADIGPENFMPTDDQGVFVVRLESRRARGTLHKEKPHAIRPTETGERSVERISLDKLEPKHLTKIRYGRDESGLRAKLENWLERDKPNELWPTMTYRDQRTGGLVEQRIRKVTISSDHKPALRIETGDDRKVDTPKPSVAREGIVRVDIFKTPDRGHFSLPIYREALTLDKAPEGYLSAKGVRPLRDGAIFLMSLYRYNYLRILDQKGEATEGYYRFYDRESQRFELWPHYTLDQNARRRCSVGTFHYIEKLVMARNGFVRDRHGQVVTVKAETRTWRPLSKPRG